MTRNDSSIQKMIGGIFVGTENTQWSGGQNAPNGALGQPLRSFPA